jgi:hypothetical protein
VVVETDNWDDTGRITLADTLHALAEQTYPRDRREVLVVLPEERWARGAELAHRVPGTTAVRAPAGWPYYRLKLAGFEHAAGEIVAFIDSDTLVGPTWLEELVRPFVRDPGVGAVLGRTRYRPAFLSRMWDVLWWVGADLPEGRVERLYTANNLALRRSSMVGALFDDPSRERGLWERVMSRQLRANGTTVWFNPRALLLHDYAPGDTLHLALRRGRALLRVRLAHPQGAETVLAAVPWLAPWLVFPGLVAKDLWRILSRTWRRDLPWAERWTPPFHALALLPVELAVLAGMISGAARRPVEGANQAAGRPWTACTQDKKARAGS